MALKAFINARCYFSMNFSLLFVTPRKFLIPIMFNACLLSMSYIMRNLSLIRCQTAF